MGARNKPASASKRCAVRLFRGLLEQGFACASRRVRIRRGEQVNCCVNFEKIYWQTGIKHDKRYLLADIAPLIDSFAAQKRAIVAAKGAYSTTGGSNIALKPPVSGLGETPGGKMISAVGLRTCHLARRYGFGSNFSEIEFMQ